MNDWLTDWSRRKGLRDPLAGRAFFDDHSLTASLKILNVAEIPEFPAYGVVPGEVNAIQAYMAETGRSPKCKLCVEAVEGNKRVRWEYWHMPHDIAGLAHHMQTK